MHLCIRDEELMSNDKPLRIHVCSWIYNLGKVQFNKYTTWLIQKPEIRSQE